MAKNNDSIKHTMIVVFTLSIICSIIVSVAAVSLKPFQQRNILLDVQRNILSVSGLLKDKIDIQATYKKHIEARLVNLKTGEFDKSVDANTYNQKAAVKDVKQSTALDPETDKSKLLRVPKLAKVFLVLDDNKKVTQIILPINGNGLWSMMYAFVAIKTDGNTIDGITYYEQGETPGLGGEVENPRWRQKWVGKTIFDDQGKMALRVVKGGAKAGDPHGVDALSGATLTSNGIQASLDFWLGNLGFRPFLDHIKKGDLNYD